MTGRAARAQGIPLAWRGRLGWVIAAVLALAWAADLWRVWQATNFHDLDVFLLAARRVVAGEDIYADTAAFQRALEAGTFSLRDDSIVWPYAYPPLIAVMFVPATALPYGLVQAGWWGLSALSLLLGGWLTLRAVQVEGAASLMLPLLLLNRFEPAVSALRLGQIEPLQLLLMALTLYALTQEGARWGAVGGAALGVATGLKFFPGALIALLVWRRRWRAAAWAVAVGAACVVGPALVTGFRLGDYMSYASIYGLGGAFAAFPLNQSLNGFLSRNLVENVFTATLKGVHLPGVAVALTLVSSAVVVAVSAWLAWPRGTDEERSSLPLTYALGVVGLLLVSPHSQVYTFVWALIPMLVLLVYAGARGVGAGWWLAGLGVYILIGRRLVVIYPGLTRFSQSHVLLGALALWGLVALATWRARRGGDRRRVGG